MRLAVLTTETPHHAYFVRALATVGHEVHVLAETKLTDPPYPVAHAFEKKRNEFEWNHWFTGSPCGLSEIAPTATYDDVNDTRAVSLLRSLAPDIVVVFGTGRIRQPTIQLFSHKIVNLHGGDPEAYRGLDTHLWAIWHQDFSALITTLHLLDEKIDHGDIVARKKVPLRKGMQLHELRAANTEVCVELVQGSFSAFLYRRGIMAQPQRQAGRYYSAMPAVLKEICVARFARYTDTL